MSDSEEGEVMDWEDFARDCEYLLEEQQEREFESLTRVFTPESGVVKRNALKYTKEGRLTRLTLPKRAFQLQSRVTFSSSKPNPNGEDHRCLNGSCGADYRQFQVLPHDGTYVCTSCGAVQLAPLIQELEPFFWHYNPAHKSEVPAAFLRGAYNSYQPKFHWNEDEKLRRLVAPPIPEVNREVIFWKLRQMGYYGADRINNPKIVVQKACRKIDKENGIKVYGRKWGEHWMTIIARFTSYRQRPPQQSDEDRMLFASKFDWFYYAWPMCSHLLPGSKKDRVRSQLPQFRWIFRQLLITFTPHEFEQWAEWLPVLSKNKEAELDLFWKRMCFVNGWDYRYPEPFITLIKSRNKKKRGLKRKREEEEEGVGVEEEEEMGLSSSRIVDISCEVHSS